MIPDCCNIDPSLSPETEICQYLDFDYFMRILVSNQYCVNQKGSFTDKRESNIFSKFMFPVRPAKEYDFPDCPEMGTLNQMHEKLREYSLTRFYYTSCWTLDINEKFYMWKTFTSKIGVRIRSTIKDFILSIKEPEAFDKISCHKMSYRSTGFYDDMHTYLVSKDKAYENEQELRFYFLNSSDNSNECPPIYIPIDYKRMIKDVLISPCVNTISARWLIDVLSAEFNLKAYQSKIQIRN